MGSDFFAGEQFQQTLDCRRDCAHIAEAGCSRDARDRVDMTSEICRYTARGGGRQFGEKRLDRSEALR